LLAFAFLVVGRIFELSPTVASRHTPLLIAVATTSLAWIAGALGDAFGTRAAKSLAAMTLWMLIGVPFAFYRRRALESITSGWLQRIVVIAILVLGLMVTLKDVTRLMDTIAVAATGAALIGLSSGSVDLEVA
jgi:hypothetical protein